MNANYATDSEGRILTVLDAANVTVEVSTPDDAPIKAEIAHPLADLGGQDAVVTIVAAPVEVQQDGSWSTEVTNFPADPASGTNQLTIAGKVDDVIAALNGGLPNDLIDGLLGVKEANSTLIFSETSQINAKLPDLSGGRLPVDTAGARLMVPMTGNGTAQPEPTTYQLNSANSNASPVGWYIKNEHATRNLRIGDATVSNSVGYLIGPLQTHFIPSSQLVGHYVVGPDGATPFSVFGSS